MSLPNPRRWTSLVVCAALLTCGKQALGAEERPSFPNIVFILADDLGYGDLGCYGQTRIQTPNIDRLASRGLRFTQCYAGSTVCAPSRSALMTGQHTGHTRVRGNANVPLAPEDITIAEMLHPAGYTSALIGKWGLGEPDSTGLPTRQGFDKFFGYLNQHHAHNYYPEYLWNNETRYPLEGNAVGDVEGVSIDCNQYSPDLILEQAEAFLNTNKSRPFFLYLAMTLPHANNERGHSEGNGMEIPAGSPATQLYADQNWPAPQKNHAAMISKLDADVGRVLDTLDQLNLTGKTIVLFTSDNGPHKEGGADPAFFGSSGPLKGYKRDLYEGGIRVPMIVSWPGYVPQNQTSDQVWAFWDVMPTLAGLVANNAETPSEIDGVSIAPVLLGEKPEVPHPPLYWEFHERGFKQATRAGKWKGVKLAPDKPVELYDLSVDIGETTNIASQHPEIAARIESFLRNARNDSPEFPIQAPPAPARPKAKAKAKAGS